MSSINHTPLFDLNAIAKIVFLSITIASILTGYVWLYHADMVHSIDRKISNQYFQTYETQLDHVRLLYRNKDFEAAAISAETALAKMPEVRRRHKVYSIKRKLLIMLIRSKMQLGKTQAADALPYAKAWAESEERDFLALKTYGQVLRFIPGKEEELGEVENLLHYRFPGMSTPAVNGK